jgi:HEAT repeat protein
MGKAVNFKYRPIVSFFFVLAVITPALLWAKGSSNFKIDLGAYYKNTNDLTSREKVIQDVLAMKKAPALPKAAVPLKKAGEDALQKSQFKEAAKSLQTAGDWAPWDAGIYSDLAQAQEKAGLYPEAIQSLKLYAMAAPSAGDQKQVQDQIKKLDDENQHWMKAQIDHLDVDAVANSLTARLTEMGSAAQEEVPILAKALKNNDGGTRGNAAKMLGGIGPGAVAAIPALADRLDDPVSQVREDAADALIQVGPEAVQALAALKDALTDEDHNVRNSASCALGNIGPKAVPAVPALIKMLKDWNTNVRTNAANALGRIGPGAKDALPALEGLLKDPDPAVQKKVDWAVKQINSTPSE